MSLVHQKVLAIADGADAAQAQPSDWNNGHIFSPALTGILADVAGTNAITGISASPGHYLKRKRNQLTPVYAFEAAPMFYAIDYAWSQTVAVNLSSSSVSTVGLSYLPDGINSTQSVNKHSIAIIDNDPTKTESCVILSVSGTTIQFQTVHNHTSGSWTIASASGGIQEAVSAAEVAGGNGGSVLMPSGNVNLYGTIVLAGSPAIKLFGHGTWSTNLVLNRYSMATKDVIYCDSTTQLISLSDFLIGGNAYHTAGWAINLKNNTAGFPTITRVHAYDTFNGLNIADMDYATVNDFKYQQVANQNCNSGNPAYGIKISGVSSNIVLDNCFVFSPHSNSGTTATDTWHLTFGIHISGADGISICNAQVRADTGIWIIADNLAFVGTVLVSNSIIDSCRSYCVVCTELATPSVYGNILFSNCHIIRNYENQPLIYISAQYSSSVIGFNSCTIGGGRRNGIYALNANNVTVDNCLILDNNLSNAGYAGVAVLGGSNISLTNNRIGDSKGGSALQTYGIDLSGTISYCNVTGNVMKGNVSSGMNKTATMTFSSIIGNVGVNNIIGGLASATVISLPTSGTNLFFMTGTTPVATINGYIGDGHEITIFPANGASFTTAGNIVAAYTVAAANTSITLIWNGTSGKWYIK